VKRTRNCIRATNTLNQRNNCHKTILHFVTIFEVRKKNGLQVALLPVLNITLKSNTNTIINPMLFWPSLPLLLLLPLLV